MMTQTSIPRGEMVAMATQYGPSLHDLVTQLTGPDGKPLDGATLIWAMSGQESSFGADMTPRHEPAYDTGGIYAGEPAQKLALAKFGRAAACSYGPLQVMYCNTQGYTPAQIGESAELGLALALGFLRRNALLRLKAQSLAEICQVWNGGHIGAATMPGYVEHVTGFYLAGLPAIGVAA